MWSHGLRSGWFLFAKEYQLEQSRTVSVGFLMFGVVTPNSTRINTSVTIQHESLPGVNSLDEIFAAPVQS